MSSLPSIFVTIASYRDPECQHTVKDLFDKAAHPERIHVGIIWQCDREADKHCFEVPAPRPQQVTTEFIPHTESKGCCWARHKAQKLWQGETYTLQIDSHLRFSEGWDNKLIALYQKLQSAGFNKPIISHYLPEYSLDGSKDMHSLAALSGRFCEEYGSFAIIPANHYPANKAPEMPLTGAFVSGHFLFGDSRWIQEVPYDPYLYFIGEEINLSVRLWTHGWDIFHPNETIAWHLYQTNSKGENQKNRPLKEEDAKDHKALDKLSRARNKHLLGTEYCNDPETLKDLEHYGLGTVRSLQQFEQFSGVNFATKTMETFTLHAEFESIRNIRPLSTHKAHFCTVKLPKPASDPAVAFLCQQLEIQSVVDIGCHLATVFQDLPHLRYIGVDGNHQAIQQCREYYRLHPHLYFMQSQPVTDRLFKADLLVCAAIPAHFNLMEYWQLLENSYLSEANYIALPVTVTVDNELSHWHDAPFHLPKPIFTIPSQHLALWRREDLQQYHYGVSMPRAILRKQLLNLIQADLTKLQQILATQKDLLTGLLQQFSNSSWEAHNHLSDQEPTLTLLKRNFDEGRHARNNLFRLIYRCEYDQLKANGYPDIASHEQNFACMLAKEAIADYLNKARD